MKQCINKLYVQIQLYRQINRVGVQKLLCITNVNGAERELKNIDKISKENV